MKEKLTLKLSRGLASIKLGTIKHSPLILTLGGIACIAGTVFLAYKSKEKVDNTLTKMEDGELDKKTGGLEIVKAVAPTLIMGTISVGCFIGSYKIQQSRIQALAGLSSALISDAAAVRKQYKEVHGDKKFTEVFNTKKETVTTYDKDGNPKEQVKTVTYNPSSMVHGVWWNNHSDEVTDDSAYNEQFVKDVLHKLELRIFSKGTMLMNEALEDLGIPKTREGALLGWTVGEFIADYRTVNVYDPDLGYEVPKIYIEWKEPRVAYQDVNFEFNREFE